MPTYRLDYLKAHGRQVEFFKQFEAADDEAALRNVRDRAAGQSMELWCGERLVCNLSEDIAPD